MRRISLQDLELGADDYITKPFSPRILIARIRAVLKEKDDKASMDDTSVIQIHELKIHPGRRDVAIKGESVELTYTEFQILYFLARRPGWVFTRYQIVDAVRGDDYPVTDRSVDVQIVGLRKKLGACGNISKPSGVSVIDSEKTHEKKETIALAVIPVLSPDHPHITGCGYALCIDFTPAFLSGTDRSMILLPRARFLEKQIPQFLGPLDANVIDALCKEIGIPSATRITVILPSGPLSVIPMKIRPSWIIMHCVLKS